jgi:hypothetical protein
LHFLDFVVQGIAPRTFQNRFIQFFCGFGTGFGLL